MQRDHAYHQQQAEQLKLLTLEGDPKKSRAALVQRLRELAVLEHVKRTSIEQWKSHHLTTERSVGHGLTYEDTGTAALMAGAEKELADLASEQRSILDRLEVLDREYDQQLAEAQQRSSLAIARSGMWAAWAAALAAFLSLFR